MRKRKDTTFIVALEYQEWWSKSFDKIIPKAISLDELDMNDTIYNMLLKDKDLSLFKIEGPHEAVYKDEKIKWSLYRINDKILKIIKEIKDLNIFIKELSTHYYNNPFGEYTKEEWPKLVKEFHRKAYEKYAIFFPKLNTLVEECSEKEKSLYQISITYNSIHP